MILRVNVDENTIAGLCHPYCKFLESKIHYVKCSVFDVVLDPTWDYGDSVQFIRCGNCHKAEEV